MDPSIVATVALPLFAAIQLGLGIFRHRDQRRALESKVIGPAWLARRSLEEDAREIMDYGFSHQCSSWDTKKERVDRIESQMREVLQISAEAGGDLSLRRKGQQAFEGWIDYADAMNHRFSTVGPDRLYAAIGALEGIQPRGADEPDLPALEDVKVSLIGRGQLEGRVGSREAEGSELLPPASGG